MLSQIWGTALVVITFRITMIADAIYVTAIRSIPGEVKDKYKKSTPFRKCETAFGF